VLLALTTNQKLGLGLTAAVFIAFSLLAALVIPRGNPDFPGKRGLVPFILVTLILMVAMLSAVEVFAKEEEHGEAAGETTETSTGTTPTETTATQTTPTTTTPTAPPPPPPAGNAQAGKAVFLAQGCGSCHTFSPAGSNGMVGPDLDDALKGKDAAFIHESIVDPNAEITSGYSAGVMPQTFGQQLSPKQIDDLVAFLMSGSS
jgi:mono/diheme cytochrome c family protein